MVCQTIVKICKLCSTKQMFYDTFNKYNENVIEKLPCSISLRAGKKEPVL